MNKPTLIIFEGADGAGKTSTITKLCNRHSWYRYMDFPKRTIFTKKKMIIDSEETMTIYLTILKNLDSNYVWVLDRSIISNLAYGCQWMDLTDDAIDWLTENFNVHLYIIDREKIDNNFEDDLIKVSKEYFNGVIDFYRNYDNKNMKIFRTRLIQDGVFDNLKQDLLIDSIMHSS